MIVTTRCKFWVFLQVQEGAETEVCKRISVLGSFSRRARTVHIVIKCPHLLQLKEGKKKQTFFPQDKASAGRMTLKIQDASELFPVLRSTVFNMVRKVHLKAAMLFNTFTWKIPGRQPQNILSLVKNLLLPCGKKQNPMLPCNLPAGRKTWVVRIIYSST